MPQVGIDGLSSITAGEKTQMDFPFKWTLSSVITHKCLTTEARLSFLWPSDTRVGMKRDLEHFSFVDNTHSLKDPDKKNTDSLKIRGRQLKLTKHKAYSSKATINKMHQSNEVYNNNKLFQMSSSWCSMMSFLVFLMLFFTLEKWLWQVIPPGSTPALGWCSCNIPCFPAGTRSNLFCCCCY